MTSRISFIVGIAVAAVTVGAPSALGRGQPVDEPAVATSAAYRAELLRSQALNEKYGLGQFEPAEHRALRLRSEALNQKYGLGEFAPSGPVESAEHRALRLRSEGMNEKYGVGGSVSDSGTRIEWAQIGVGFGIALLFAVGLGLAVRVTRIRTLAH